jgi:hypothetical protein
MLDAEAAAGIAEGAVAQLVAGHAQGQGHHGVQRERTHEIGGDVVAFFLGLPFGHHYRAFDRRARIARVAHGEFHRVRRVGKGGFRLAIAEGVVADDVAAHAFVQDGLVDGGDGFEFGIAGNDQVGRVLGEIAGIGHHHGHRLADVAHAVHGQRPHLHRRLDADHERFGPVADIKPREDGAHAWRGGGAAGVDAVQDGVCMRGAHHHGLQGAGLDADIVAVLAAADQQRGVFDALHRAAGVGLVAGILPGRVVELHFHAFVSPGVMLFCLKRV